ncbi:MAG: hypothetical protein HOP15_12355 [Planctomycetes bacterium]|nr:hypothetical protein [Planctomycetota bacterium]
MSQHLRQWLVLLKADVTVSGLQLEFVPERSRVLRVGLRHMPSAVRYRAQVEGRVVSIRFPPVSAGRGLVGLLDVVYSGDAPLISAIEWRADPVRPEHPFSVMLEVEHLLDLGLVLARGDEHQDVAPVPWEMASLMHGDEIGFVAASDAVASTSSAAAGSNYAVRREAQAMDEAARRFFFALDDATLGPDVDAGRRELIESVTETLVWRVRERASVGDRYVPKWEPSDRRTRRLIVVSAFVRTLMETHLEERVHPRIVEWAFLRFATECLSATHLDPDWHRRLLSHGAPAGELFFSFAELALACIELDIDRSHWERHLPILVRTAHAYAEHAGVRNSLGRYIYLFRENRRFPLRRLQAIDRNYHLPSRVPSALFLEDRFTSLLSKALSVPPQDPVPEKARDLVHTANFRRQRTALVHAKQAREFFGSIELFQKPLVL